MLKQRLENVLTVRYRTNVIILTFLALSVLSIAAVRHTLRERDEKLPYFKLVIFAEKPVVKLGEDIIVDVLLKNEGEGNGIVSSLFFNDYSTMRVPKNSITFDIRDANGKQIVQNKDNVYYPQYAQATLKSFTVLSPDDIIGLQINLMKDNNFLYPINNAGIYTIQAILETECRKYVEESIKIGAIKESDLARKRKKLEHFINGTFKSNTIQIEVQK